MKRLFCMLLTAILLLSLLPFAAMAADGTTIYFENTDNWSTVNVYYWSDSNTGYCTWPGSAMTLVEGNIYSFNLPAGVTKVIFNNGSTQTGDLDIGTQNLYVYNSGWSTYEGGCEHSWGTGTVTKEATCTEAGAKTYTCSKCSDTKTEAIAATGHNLVDGTCTVCGASDRIIYFKNTDNWGTVNAYAWSDADGEFLGGWPGTAMTSLGDGLYSISVPDGADKIIFNNGSSQTSDLSIPEKDNLYTYSDNAWSYYSTCSHSYSEAVTTQPTCTTAGVKTYTCSNCGDTYTEAIDALGHSYVNGYCSVCGEKEPCSVHAWDNGTITTVATCTTAGVKTYTCASCGETKTETIKAPGHTIVDGVCSVCGYKEPVIDYVEIYTAADLVSFANRVNAGETTLNGKLMANIDLKGASWTAIGIYCPDGDVTQSVFFRGIFDGNGYTVSNFTVAGTDCVGLFGYAEMATIKNLGIINATMTGWNAGAVIGYGPTSTIINCYAIGCTINGNTSNPVAVNSEAVHVGAIAGSNAGTVKNCYAVNCTLSISFVGQFNSMSPLGGVICSNNYYCSVSGDFTNTRGATQVTSAQLSSGEVAYKLNDAVWGQEIGKDTYPVIYGKTVYFENNTYTNESTGECNHNYVSKVTVPPSCGNTGVMTYTCSKCGDSYNESITALQHSYTSTVVAPTCAAQGYTLYTCSGCGDSYKDSYTAVVDHSYSSAVTKAPTCSAAGIKTFTCSGCGDSYTEAIDALGHSYVDGICGTCGEADPDYVNPIVQPVITVGSPSVSFEGEIRYNIYFSASQLDDVAEMGLALFNTKVADGTIENADQVIPGYTGENGSYMVQTDGIAPKNMGDALYFRIYAKLTDGSYVYTDIRGYNAIVYANNILKNSSDANMRSLVVAMLNYGAAAQQSLSYKTDSLMNAGLTAEQQALVKPYDADMMDDLVSVPSVKVGKFAYNSAGYSGRKPSVSFDGAFAINYYFTTNFAPENGMKLYYWTLADYNACGVLTAGNATGSMDMVDLGSNQFWGNVEDIVAKNIDETVFVAAVYTYGGVEYATGVLAYSVGSYCESMIDAGNQSMIPVCSGAAVYGYYAKEYFNALAQ